MAQPQKARWAKDPKGIAARSGVGESDWLGACEANDLSSRKEEDRGGTTSTLGKIESGEEGGVRHDARIKARSFAGGHFLFMRNHCVLDAECARQYLRPCSAALSHWLLSAANSQRHTSHSQRRPPAMLLYQSWRCFAGDGTLPRFRLGKSTWFFLVFMQDWMHCQR
jgi:hypothetical protein